MMPTVDSLIFHTEQTMLLARAAHLMEGIDPALRCIDFTQLKSVLRWLRNLHSSEQEIASWLDRPQMSEQIARIEQLGQVMGVYTVALRDSLPRRPGLKNDTIILDANNASGAIALGVLEHTLIHLPENHPSLAKLEAIFAVAPPIFQLRINQSVRRLFDAVAFGIEHLTGVYTDERTPVDRLADMSARLNQTAEKLQTVDHLEDPAREESVELAREILKRLKGGMGDKTMQEMMEKNSPEEKAVFAHKVEEMADSYHELLMEAAQNNPQIMHDPSIKTASDTIGGFAHGITVMAVAELPPDSSDAQLLTADLEKMPVSWKKMVGEPVGKLVQQVDKGMEQAIKNINEPAQAAGQSKAMADARMDEIAERRKRRIQSPSSQISQQTQARNVRNNATDSNINAVAEPSRRRRRQRENNPKVMIPGLGADTMAAVQALGSSLRSLSKEAASLAVPAAEEPARSEPSPAMNPGGEQSFTQQVKGERSKPRSNSQTPKNTGKRN